MKKIILTLIFLLIPWIAFADTMDFYVSAGSDDGYCSKAQPGSYPPTAYENVNDTSTFIYARKDYAPGTSMYYIATVLMRFNTSSLPDDATITGAKLYLYFDYPVYNANSRNLSGEYYSFTSISISDWVATVGTTAFDVALSGLGTGTNEINLSTLTSISKTGYTGFRIGVSGNAPTGDNGIEEKCTFESTTHIPKLTVTYSTGYGHKIYGVTPKKVYGVTPSKINGI